jgi:hypothetical protein
METFSELFEETLKDIYYAEKAILKALPKMAKPARVPLDAGWPPGARVSATSPAAAGGRSLHRWSPSMRIACTSEAQRRARGLDERRWAASSGR